MESLPVNGDDSEKAQPPHTSERAAVYHKAGHIVAAWFLKHSDMTDIVLMNKLKIECCPIPRDKFRFSTENEVFDYICVYLGGFVSEYVFLESGSWMSQYDLRLALKLGVELIRRFRKRMDDVTLGARVVDLIYKCFRVTSRLLKEHSAEVDKISLKLLLQGTMSVQDVEDLLGPRICMHTHLTIEYLDHSLGKDNSDMPDDLRGWASRLLLQTIKPSIPFKYIFVAILFLIIGSYFIQCHLIEKSVISKTSNCSLK